jgi:peptidoglycan/xylan/chitin deacetylase (PgdA/CDA1 family)
MDRRQFLAAGAAAASLLTIADLTANPFDSTPAFAWPKQCIDVLPKSPIKRMAWTLDDGFSQSALAAYVKLLEDHHDLRMTMFVLPRSSAWKNLAKPISALAGASGKAAITMVASSRP